jgi:hypothetical protein
MRSSVLFFTLCAACLCAGFPTPTRAQISFDGGGAGGGALVAGQSTTTCDSTIDGALRYNSAAKCMDFCDGSAWRSLNCSVCPASGLIGHWKMDDGAGNATAADSSSGNTGTLTNMDPNTDWVAGKIGGALDFDGTNDSVTTTLPQLTTAITIAAWVYLSSDRNDYETIVARGSTTDRPNYEFRWGSGGSDDRLELVWRKSDDTAHAWITSNTQSLDATVGQWAHLAVTHAWGTTNSAFYVNGNVQSASTNTTLPYTGGTQSGSIGALLYNSDTNPLLGKIDDVRVYNRALSAAEITALYNGGAGCQ